MTLRKDERVHFIGIGGIGMSAIAQILVQKGYTVSGSDLRATLITNRLSAMGVTVFIGQSADNVEEADVVVYSSAIREDNPEMSNARARGLRVIRRAEMLSQILEWGPAIVCGGSHGKTTTSSMVTTILESQGKKPTSIIGGELNDIGGNAKVGAGEWYVAEGDESDGSLVLLHPDVAVITNIDREHLDHYPDLASVQDCFRQFMRGCRPGAKFVLCADDAPTFELSKEFPKDSLLLYGFGPNAEYRLSDLRLLPRGSVFTLHRGEELLGEVTVHVPGRHNALNATAACLATMQTGLSFAEAVSGVAHYKGVGRRFERKGEAGGVEVFDDYGHHPTEIAATMSAFFSYAQGRKILVFQPHRYTRTAHLMKEFCEAFKSWPLDMLILTEIYAASEDPIEGVTGARLAEEVRNSVSYPVTFVPKVVDIAKVLAQCVRPGDTVMTQGAGDVWKAGKALLEMLGGTD